MSSNTRKLNRAISVVALVAFALTAVACAGTRGRRSLPEESGFLRDYSQLTEREGAAVKLSYVNSRAAWSGYDAVWIESVSMWANSKTSKVKPEDRQMLIDFFYQALHDELSKNFRIVDGPRPGVLQFRAALTEAKGANVPLKAITTIVPQLRLISTAVGVGADIVATVGEATIEAEVLDSMTKERLAAGVDQRAGKKAFTQLKTWSDVKAACEHWAKALRERLIQEGVRKKA
jgi:hypothetical protein